MLDKDKLCEEIERHVNITKSFDDEDERLKASYNGMVIGLRTVLMLIDSGFFDKED